MSRISKKVGQTDHERIQQLRICLAVHSYIYYEMADNLVTDYKWQAWADELVVMQAAHPEYTDEYDSWWDDWDGTTGFHLCKIPGLAVSAARLLRSEHEQIK